MEIKLHNSMKRATEVFTPADPARVTMYVCGPTVYDLPHLGNARPAIVFDTLFRLLRHVYGADHVQYARNYTDVDDKIIDAANARNQSITDLTDHTINQYRMIMRALGNTDPTFTPRATENINEIIDQIIVLIERGHAYASGQQIMFDTASWKAHGKLSGHKQEDLESHREIKGGDLKRNPGDFVLWKPAEDGPGWMSPWGHGRPGWHIECSAMIDKAFNGQTIDIHGGGADLRFPHHECEISQFEASHDHPLANYWLHNAMITVDGQKMSKSLGNFITVQDVIKKNPHMHDEVIRLALLSTHYRSPLDWTDELLSQARQALTGWHLALETIDAPAEVNEHSTSILAALASDLNTPLAIARIHEKISEFASDPERIAAGVRYAAEVMGIHLVGHDRYLRGGGNERYQIEMLIAKRVAARQAKNFTESDRLREQLVGMGLMIEDRAEGTKWRHA